MPAVMPTTTISPTSVASAATLLVLKRTCSSSLVMREAGGSAVPSPSSVRRCPFLQWVPPFMHLFGDLEVANPEPRAHPRPLQQCSEHTDDAVAGDDHAGCD